MHCFFAHAWLFLVILFRFIYFICSRQQDVLRDNLERAVELLADTIINPQVTPEEIEEQKAVRAKRSVEKKTNHDLGYLLPHVVGLVEVGTP